MNARDTRTERLRCSLRQKSLYKRMWDAVPSAPYQGETGCFVSLHWADRNVGVWQKWTGRPAATLHSSGSLCWVLHALPGHFLKKWTAHVWELFNMINTQTQVALCYHSQVICSTLGKITISLTCFDSLKIVGLAYDRVKGYSSG